MYIVIVFHVLSVVIWVGGMFFAYMCLRPVAGSLLEPPVRLQLWSHTFARFFVWVWIAVVLIPVSGHVMIAMLGGFASVGMYVYIMLGSGYLMIAVFLHVFFAPYRRLKQAVVGNDWQEAGRNLNQIRRIVVINLLLGLFTVTVAVGGRYFS